MASLWSDAKNKVKNFSCMKLQTSIFFIENSEIREKWKLVVERNYAQ